MSNSTIVVYNSAYGSTEKYAQWIANNLQADIKKSSDVAPRDLANYDTVVYGGSLHAVGIKGIKLITRNIDMFSGKKLVVFSVGCSPANEETIKSVEKHNFPGELGARVKHFYLHGAFDYSKLKFSDRIMMNMLRIMLKSKKETLTDGQKGLLALYETPDDWTDESTIKPLIAYLTGNTQAV